jgi:hypothetical protein
VAVNTLNLIEEFQAKGFELREVLMPKSKNGRGTHTVRMSAKSPIIIGGEVLKPEIVIVNSYDWSSKLKIAAGVFRLVCSNGLVIADQRLPHLNINLRHIGTEAEIVEQTVKTFSENFHKIGEVIQKMGERILTEEEAIKLAMKAARSRWKKSFTPAQAKALLKAARPEDNGMDAWKVMNRLQENLVKGGVNVPGRKRAIRPLAQPVKIHKVNQEVFSETLNFCEN